MGGAGCLDREQPLVGQEHVAVEAAALVARPHHVDDARDPQRPGAGHVGAHGHDVVELEVARVVDGDPEVEGSCVLGAEDHADGLARG